MIRSLVTLTCLTVVACAGPDVPAATDGPGSDSTMVVATEARVPSGTGPRVVFLGTSLTAGFGLEVEADGYVSVLARLAETDGHPIRAVNAGVSGETSAGGLRRLDWILREPLDVLVVELGANDGLRGQAPDAMAENLTEIIQRTRTRYPEVRFMIAGMEAPPNLGDAYTSAFRAVFPAVAEEEDAVLIPFLLVGVAGVPELNQDDRIHPTPEGHRRIAETVWPILRDVLNTLPEDGS